MDSASAQNPQVDQVPEDSQGVPDVSSSSASAQNPQDVQAPSDSQGVLYDAASSPDSPGLPVDGGGDLPADMSMQHPRNLSPQKKLFVLVIIFAVIMILCGILLLIGGKNQKKPSGSSTPTSVPVVPATITILRPTVAASPSAVISQTPIATPSAKTGRLVFIKDGDIYESDFTGFSLLIKNTIPAGDRLTWSPKGNKISWRPKSDTATPSAIMVYDRISSSSSLLNLGSGFNGEVVDLAWSTDENEMAVILKDGKYKAVVIPVSGNSGQTPKTLYENSAPIKQILWPDMETMFISGDEGIMKVNTSTSSAIVKTSVYWMALSPDKTKLLYSVGNANKSDLYIVNRDGTENKKLPIVPPNVNMGSTNLTQDKLTSGFIPYALWLPKGDRLFVGYHYLTNLPLVGIYDLINNSFSAISPFIFYSTDVFSDNLRLIGSRINNTGQAPIWNLSIFTLEDNAKLSVIRTFPGGHTPAFYSGE